MIFIFTGQSMRMMPMKNGSIVNNGELGFFRKYPFSLLNIQNCVIRYR